MTRTFRGFRVFVTAFGLLSLVYGILSLYDADLIARALEPAPKFGAFPWSSASEWRHNYIAASALLTALGIATSITSIGLFLTKEWARKTWLGLSVVLALVTIYWLRLLSWKTLYPEFWAGVTLVLAVPIFSWIYLNRKKTRELFAQNK